MIKKILFFYGLITCFALMLFIGNYSINNNLNVTDTQKISYTQTRKNSNSVSTFDTISNDFNYNDVLSNIYFTSFSYNTNKRYGSTFILEFTPFLNSNDIISYNFILSVNSTYYLSYTDFTSYNLVGSYSFDIYDFDFDFTTLKLSSSTITLMNDNKYYFNFNFTFIDVLNKSFTISINSPNFSNITSLVDFINIGLSNVSDSINSLRFDNRFSNGEFFNYNDFTFSFYHSSLAIKGVYDIYSYYLYENSYNEGYEDGLLDGYDPAYNEGYESGYDVGYNHGYVEGSNSGYDRGYNYGYNEALLNSTSNVISPTNIDRIDILYMKKAVYLSLTGNDLDSFLNRTWVNGGIDFYQYLSSIYSFAYNNDAIDTERPGFEDIEIQISFKFPLDSSNLDLTVSNFEKIQFFDTDSLNDFTYYIDGYKMTNPPVNYKVDLSLDSSRITRINFTTYLNFDYTNSSEFSINNVAPMLKNSYVSDYDAGYNYGYSTGINESSSTIKDLQSENLEYKQDNKYLSDRINSLLNDDQFTMSNLFWSIGSIPFETIKTIWNFEFLGVNLTQFITGLLTAFIIIWIFKKVL